MNTSNKNSSLVPWLVHFQPPYLSECFHLQSGLSQSQAQLTREGALQIVAKKEKVSMPGFQLTSTGVQCSKSNSLALQILWLESADYGGGIQTKGCKCSSLILAATIISFWYVHLSHLFCASCGGDNAMPIDLGLLAIVALVWAASGSPSAVA
jgi:hypothetical protein